MAIAGRVSPIPKGDYDTGTVYDVLDIVGHNGKPWICKKANTIGVEPSTDNDDYWMLLIDVDITNADTLGGNRAGYFVSKEEMMDAFETVQVTLPMLNWVGEQAPYTQTATVESIKATDVPMMFFIDDGTTEQETKNKNKSYGYISYFDTANGSITFTCKYNKPIEDVTVGLRGIFPVYTEETA